MAIDYKWEIKGLEVYPQVEGQTNVAYLAHWSCIGTEGENEGRAVGHQKLGEYKAGEAFVPYDQLTEEQVISWVKDAMNAVVPESNRKGPRPMHSRTVTEIEDNIAKQIESQKKPPVVAPALPWAAN